MQKITVRGILKSSCTGGKTWAGYVSEAEEVPAGLVETPVEVLDPEDGSGNVWVLAHPDGIPLLASQDLTDLSASEVARAAKAKLTDEELAALGLTRD